MAKMNDELAALFAAHGVNKESIPDKPISPKEYDDSPQRQMFHGQAVMRSLEYPLEEKALKRCKGCGDPFLTNYMSNAYCSILCVEHDLKMKYGISWQPSSRIKKERWEVLSEPEILPLKALRAMKTIILRTEDRLGEEIEPLFFQKKESGRTYSLPVEPSPEPVKESLLPQIQLDDLDFSDFL